MSCGGRWRRSPSRIENPRSLLQAKSEQQGSGGGAGDQRGNGSPAAGARQADAARTSGGDAGAESGTLAPNAQFASAVIAALPALVAQVPRRVRRVGWPKRAGQPKGLQRCRSWRSGLGRLLDCWGASSELRAASALPRLHASAALSSPVDHHLDLRRLGHGHAVCADEAWAEISLGLQDHNYCPGQFLAGVLRRTGVDGPEMEPRSPGASP